MKHKKIVPLLILFTLVGCTRTIVKMTSEPSDAQVTIKHDVVRYTPFNLNISNASEKGLFYAVRKNGYETVFGVITPKGGEFHIDLNTQKITTSEPFISIEGYKKQEEARRIETIKYLAEQEDEKDYEM